MSHYSNYGNYQREPSYGNYWQQQPMKTFAGQPNWATQKEVDRLDARVDHLEKEMNSEYSDSKKHGDYPCGRCPQPADCAKMTDDNQKNHCEAMLAQCKEYC